eukprot:863270-Rhodomonas_salina.3
MAGQHALGQYETVRSSVEGRVSICYGSTGHCVAVSWADEHADEHALCEYQAMRRRAVGG